MTSRAPAAGASRNTAIDAVACALAAGIAAVIGWVGMRPTLDSEGDRRETALQAQQAQQQLAGAQQEYLTLRAALAAAERQLAENNVQLVAADRLTVRQEQLAAALTRGGLQLDQLVVGARTPGKLVDCVPFHLSGQGKFPGVVGQMHNLRTAFPDMAITSFQMSASGNETENSGQTTVRFMFEVAWYTDRDGGEP